MLSLAHISTNHKKLASPRAGSTRNSLSFLPGAPNAPVILLHYTPFVIPVFRNTSHWEVIWFYGYTTVTDVMTGFFLHVYIETARLFGVVCEDRPRVRGYPSERIARKAGSSRPDSFWNATDWDLRNEYDHLCEFNYFLHICVSQPT